MNSKIAPLLAAMVVACGEEIAAPVTTHAIPGVFSTGVDSRGELLPTGAVDSHYVFSINVDGIGLEPRSLVIDDLAWRVLGGPWLPNDDKSQWIGPVRSVGTSAPVGEYRYTIAFELTEMNHRRAWLQGRWAADDRGVSVLLNGADTGLSPTNSSAFSAEFTLDRGFVTGANTLEFVVRNLSPDSRLGSNPTGLRVELVGRAAL